jgi:hypothetical protein
MLNMGNCGEMITKGRSRFLTPGFVERPVREHVVQLALRVTAFAIAVQEQHHRPGRLSRVAGR